MAESTKNPRILAIDFVRVYAVILVVAVHVITQPIVYSQTLPEAFLMLFHVSREIFLLITGLVLTYTTASLNKSGVAGWLRFYWRRYPLILIPYFAWTLIYMWSNQDHLRPFGTFWDLLVSNLRSGDASYQLYFLIVTMKLYAVFPLLRWALERTRKLHPVILAVSGAAQLTISGAIRYGWWNGSHYFAPWAAKPDAVLLSYQFYLLAGCIGAFYLPQLTDWVRRNFRVCVLLALAAADFGIVSYYWQLEHGSWALQASQVFQPMLVIESVAGTLGLFAIGVRWEDRGARGRSTYLLLADVSFGIYLGHILILNYLYQWAGELGLLARAATAPTWLNVAALLAIGVPITYASTAILIAIARRTPLSLWLAGRPWSRKQKTLSLAKNAATVAA